VQIINYIILWRCTRSAADVIGCIERYNRYRPEKSSPSRRSSWPVLQVSLLPVSRHRRADRRKRFGRTTTERRTPRMVLVSNRRPRLTASDSASPPLDGVASGRRCGTGRSPPPSLGQPSSSSSMTFVLADLRPRGPPNRNRPHDSVLSTGGRTHTPTMHATNALKTAAVTIRAVARAMVAAHRPCNNTDQSAACRARSAPPLPSSSADPSHAIISQILPIAQCRDNDDDDGRREYNIVMFD